MTATSHAIIGTLIAAKIGNPAIAIPLALCSHVLADLFPHWDFGTHRKTKSYKRYFLEAFLDVMISFIASYLLIFFVFPTTNLLYAFIMIIAAQFLDWATSFYIFFHITFPPFNWIYKFSRHTNVTLDKPWGIINQIIAVVTLIIIAKII